MCPLYKKSYMFRGQQTVISSSAKYLRKKNVSHMDSPYFFIIV